MTLATLNKEFIVFTLLYIQSIQCQGSSRPSVRLVQVNWCCGSMVQQAGTKSELAQGQSEGIWERGLCLCEEEAGIQGEAKYEASKANSTSIYTTTATMNES